MMRAIAPTRYRHTAAILAGDLFDIAERPATPCCVEFEERARPHVEPVVDAAAALPASCGERSAWRVPAAASPRKAFPRLMAARLPGAAARPCGRPPSASGAGDRRFGATGHRLINPRISSSVQSDMAGAMRADRAAKMTALRFFPTRRSFQLLVRGPVDGRHIPTNRHGYSPLHSCTAQTPRVEP